MTTIETKWIITHQAEVHKAKEMKAKKITTIGFMIFTAFMIGFCLLVILFGVVD
jgi:hypothetical protein